MQRTVAYASRGSRQAYPVLERRASAAAIRLDPALRVPQVPALVLQSGVLRCRVPPHPPGIVRICLTNGDGRPRSRLHPFEYRDAPQANAGAPNRCAFLASASHAGLALAAALSEICIPSQSFSNVHESTVVLRGSWMHRS